MMPEAELPELAWVQERLWSFILIYVCVMAAIVLDLISGVRKAKKRGECRTSIGYRRTIDKVCRYYNTLLVFSVVDAITMIVELHRLLGIPAIPFFTAFWAIYLCFIEFKSINEKPDQKVTLEGLHHIARLLGRIHDPQAFADAVRNLTVDQTVDNGSAEK